MMRNFILLLIAVIVSFNTLAQNSSAGYHSQSFVLQSSANASAFPEANVVLGFPAFSNVNLGMQWPLSLNDFLQKQMDDSLHFNLPLLRSNLKSENILNSSFRNQLFHFGLKVGNKKNIFVYIGDELVVDAGMQFSNKLVDYLTQGNANFINQRMVFDSQKIEFTAYNSLYLGTAIKVNKKLEIGARIKLLRGIANIHTQKLKFSAFTDSTASPIFSTSLSSDILIQTSGRGAADKSLPFDPSLNKGFAIDLGASYVFTDQLTASIALNDVGSITWDKLNNNLFTTNGEKEFDIVGLSQTSAGGEDLLAQLETLSDSLLLTLQPSEVLGAYSTKLNPKLFLGLSYSLNSKHSFSALYNWRRNFSKGVSAISLGYQFQLLNSLELLTSLSRFSENTSLAAGFVWSPGPVQLHVLVDNIMFVDLFDAKSLFLQFGLSFRFGEITNAVKK